MKTIYGSEETFEAEIERPMIRTRIRHRWSLKTNMERGDRIEPSSSGQAEPQSRREATPIEGIPRRQESEGTRRNAEHRV